MASRYEVEVTIGSARDLKNVNWRHGPVKAYAVVWVDPAAKCSTKADVDGDTSPVWDEKLTISLGDRPLDDAVLFIDVVHAGSGDDVKPLIGSARLPLREVLDEVGIGGKSARSIKLKRPSGRPHGRIDVKIKIQAREPPRYYDPYAPSYNQSTGSRDYPAGAGYGGGGYGQPYGAPPPSGYPYSAPPAYGQQQTYGAPPPAYGYGAAPPAYGAAPPAYGAAYGAAPPAYGQEYGAGPVVVEKKKSKFGMGTGLAVGAAAGLLGGLAIAEGVDYVEDKIEDDVAEKVEDDVGYDGYGDDF